MTPGHGTRSFGSRYSRIDRCALFVRSNPYERPANPAFTVSENGRQKNRHRTDTRHCPNSLHCQFPSLVSDPCLLDTDWWSRSGSNRRPQACKARALPTELRPQKSVQSGLPSRSCGRKPVFAPRGSDAAAFAASQRRLVGPGRVERPTSRLSGVRSNHLSYEPENALRRVSGSLRQDNRD